MSAKKEVDVSVFDDDNEYLRDDSDWPPKDPASFLAWFTAKVALIPPQFMDAAYINLSGGGGDDYSERHGRISIGYSRPETDAELAEREEQSRRYAEQEEERDRRTFERLRQRFGS
jgi:hypothetical protein